MTEQEKKQHEIILHNVKQISRMLRELDFSKINQKLYPMSDLEWDGAPMLVDTELQIKADKVATDYFDTLLKK